MALVEPFRFWPKLHHWLFVVGCLVGIIVRCCAFLASAHDLFSTRVEFTTPWNSYKHGLEDAYLYCRRVSPYTGPAARPPPLHIIFASLTLKNPIVPFVSTWEHFDENHIQKLDNESFVLDLTQDCEIESTPWFLFAGLIMIDLIAASAIFNIGLIVYEEEHMPLEYAAALSMWYFINPLSMGTTLSLSSSSLYNASVILALYYSMEDNWFMVSIFSSVCFLLQPDYIILFYGLCHIYLKNKKPVSAIKTLFGFTLLTIIQSYAYYVALGSWDFLSTYKNMLTIHDLTPNIGLYWYFFTEIFPNYKDFFNFTFIYCLVLIIVIIGMRFRNYGLFVFFYFTCVVSVFKPYPTASDFVLVVTFIPLVHRELGYLKYYIIYGTVCLTTIIAFPLLFDMWIYKGTEHANYFFAANLTFACCQVWFLVDMTYSVLKYESLSKCESHSDNITEQKQPIKID